MANKIQDLEFSPKNIVFLAQELNSTKTQLRLCKSWKRANDLKKYLKNLERKWKEYEKINKTCENSYLTMG